MPKFIDYSGKKIGRVNVINLIEKRSGGTYWQCKCDCGIDFTCWNANFRRGERFECKNCWYERRRGIDLTGRKYGRWTVIKRVIDSNNKTQWHCKCDCGAEGNVSSSCLGRPHRSMSCGCLGRKMRSKHVNTSLYPPKHLLSKTRFYSTKTSLIHKCYSEKNKSYPLYGGKGITICDLWRNGVRDMYEWSIENGWEEGDVLLLKEGEKQYNPETTVIVKENDFRSDVALRGGIQITYKGETHSCAKWAQILNVDKSSFIRKIRRLPSVEEVFDSEFKKQKFTRDPSLAKHVVDMYLSGKTQSEIGRALDTNSGNVRYHLLKSGVELRENDIKLKREEIKDEEIKLLLDKELSLNSIAKELNCSWTTIRNRIAKMNGEKRDRSKG